MLVVWGGGIFKFYFVGQYSFIFFLKRCFQVYGRIWKDEKLPMSWIGDRKCIPHAAWYSVPLSIKRNPAHGTHETL